MESQVRVLRQYCEQNNITDVEFFTDEGVSGTKSSRPALDRLMAAVENNEISSVVVYSFSRFARSTTHLLNALQRSIPETWVTDYSGDIGNTFILNGSSTGSTLLPPSSKYPRS